MVPLLDNHKNGERLCVSAAFLNSSSPVPAFFSSQDVDLSIYHSSTGSVASLFHGGAHGPLVGLGIVTLHLIGVLCRGVPSTCKKQREAQQQKRRLVDQLENQEKTNG